MSRPSEPQKTGVAPRPQQQPESSLERIEALAKKYAISVIETKGRFERAVMLADGMEVIREAVRPIMPKIMRLMNSRLGFMTDRKPTAGKKPEDPDYHQSLYSEEVVLDCLIEATLRGLYPVGNEWNIIASQMYPTKEGYTRLVREIEGLSDLKLEPGVPKMAQGGAIVPYRASWKLHGRGYVVVRDIPVRLNAGMGADGALGKAKRKMLASIYERCTGSKLTEADAEDDDLPALPPPKPVNGTALPVDRIDQLVGMAQKLRLSEDEWVALVTEFGGKEGQIGSLLPGQAESLGAHLEDLLALDAAEREAVQQQG